MPIDHPSKAIVCPECNSRIFERRFIEHLTTVHGMEQTMAQTIFDRKEYPPPVIKGKKAYYSPARIQPVATQTRSKAASKPKSSDLSQLSEDDLLAEILKRRGEG